MAGPAAAARFAYNRAARIYVTSWLVVSVYVYYKFMLHPDELEGVDWFRSLTLLPQPGLTNAMPVNWTLSFELYFYIMFAVGILFGNRKTLLAVTAFAILLNVWSRMDTNLPAAGFLGSAHIYEFIAGCAVGLLYERGLLPKRPLIAAVVGIVFIAAGIAYGVYGLETEISKDAVRDYRVAFFLPASVALVIAAVQSEHIFARPAAICGPRDSVLCALSVARAAAAYMVRSHRDRWIVILGSPTCRFHC